MPRKLSNSKLWSKPEGQCKNDMQWFHFTVCTNLFDFHEVSYVVLPGVFLELEIFVHTVMVDLLLILS